MSALEQASEMGLMTIYQAAKVLAWDDSEVRVGFPEGGITSEIALDREKVARMKVFIAKYAGSPLDFSVQILNEKEQKKAVSIAENAKERSKKEHELRLQEAKEHPMTKKVLRTFGAAIKKVEIENV